MTNKKNIILLGSTGSIGNSVLKLIRQNKNIFNLIGVSAHNNAELLSSIVDEFDVPNVVLSNVNNKANYKGKYKLNTGHQALIDLAAIECDIVITGIIGVTGLHSAFSAISAGNDLAIANKETLVAAGKIFIDKAFEMKVNILPVDSEHSAIFQCLNMKNINNLEHITLTASGGPFLNTPTKDMKNIKPKDAVKHPVWSMGKKISIDSATMINKAFEMKVNILPVDSEHSAIFQCLNMKNINNLEHITLTASGGPFLNTPIKDMKNIKPKDAVKHPVWSMGKKISIDSATMINKALEIIEASVLFNLKSEQIDVVIHPQSIVHGLVHYKDGSIIANLGYPDMVTPISVALGWPNRLNLNLKKFSLIDVANLSFFKPDLIKFPGLKLGWDALDNPSCSPVVLNAANEIAVESFLDNKIKFTDIINVIFEILNIYSPTSPSNISDVVEIDKLARSKTLNYIKGFN